MAQRAGREVQRERVIMTETLVGGPTDIDGCVYVISAFQAHYIDAATA